MAISYSDDNEGTHAAGPDLDWQESVFVHWYDPTAGIGGAHRLGHEPNRDNGGRSALECFVFTTKGTRFRRVDYQLPLEEPTTPRGFRAGGSSWHVDGGSPRLEIHEPGLDANLTMENFYPLTDFFPPSGSMVEDFAKHHYETSGRITGPVTIAGTTIDVDGMCHRDHSWGTRKADTLLSHRWVSGTFGPDLSFGSIVWHAADDSLVKVGYLVRDGEVIYADDVDVIAWLEPDGLTIRGGQVTWQLPDGETFTLDCRQVDAVVSQLHNSYYVDSIGTVEYGGRTGTCDFEISNNPRAGTRTPGVALNAAHADGISQTNNAP